MPEPQPRSTRLFALAAALKGRRVHRAEDLAARLGVSVRTVYRDVVALRAMGVPVEGEPGVGLRLADAGELPAIPFSRAELEALALGARMVATWADPALADAARAALARVEAVLPEAQRETLLGVPLFAAEFSEIEQPAALGAVRVAAGDRRRVAFDYDDKAGAASRRTIWPLAVHFWGQRWTVAGWCELRRGFRVFRLDRMHGVRVLDAFPDVDGCRFADLMAHVRADTRASS